MDEIKHISYNILLWHGRATTTSKKGLKLFSCKELWKNVTLWRDKEFYPRNGKTNAFTTPAFSRSCSGRAKHTFHTSNCFGQSLDWSSTDCIIVTGDKLPSMSTHKTNIKRRITTRSRVNGEHHEERTVLLWLECLGDLVIREGLERNFEILKFADSHFWILVKSTPRA